MTELLYIALFILASYSFMVNKGRAASLGKFNTLHSQPYYHGLYSSILIFLPAIILLIFWSSIQNIMTNLSIRDFFVDVSDPGLIKFYIDSVINYSNGVSSKIIEHDGFMPAVEKYSSLTYTSTILKVIVVTGLSIILLRASIKVVTVDFKARDYVESMFTTLMKFSSVIAIFVTIGIVLSLLFETLRFFATVNVFDFLFGLHWSPQTAIRVDQVGSSGSFGAIPVFLGTILISIIAMLVAVPIGMYSAIYLSQYASETVRTYAKPIIEILAGIPTVVYGFFAVITVAPFFRDLGDKISPGTLSGESAIIAGSVMGIMIIPFITSLTDDAMNAVPSSLKEGSLAMGATVSETTRQVIIPASFHGIVASFLLAFSRAIGETMIVVMAAGFAANLTLNPFESVTTVTVQIVGLLTGDQEFDSAKTLSAFALAFVLFFLTLILNIIALNMVKKYREQYE
jgi:phosphate transport system permease protein